MKGLDLFPENEKLLRTPRKSLDRAQKIKTDVIIIGGGNAFVTPFSYCLLRVRRGRIDTSVLVAAALPLLPHASKP